LSAGFGFLLLRTASSSLSGQRFISFAAPLGWPQQQRPASGPAAAALSTKSLSVGAWPLSLYARRFYAPQKNKNSESW
jgi:hypothetical protein